MQGQGRISSLLMFTAILLPLMHEPDILDCENVWCCSCSILCTQTIYEDGML